MSTTTAEQRDSDLLQGAESENPANMPNAAMPRETEFKLGVANLTAQLSTVGATAVVAGDPQVWDAAEVHNPGLRGDTEFNFRLVAQAARELQLPLIIPGDAFHFSAKSGMSEMLVRARAAVLGLTVAGVQGNHEYAGSGADGKHAPWLQAAIPEFIWLDGKVVEIAGLKFAGIDWCPGGRQEFIERLHAVPAGVDVLICHQGFRDLLGFAGAWEFSAEDFNESTPPLVICGHVHTHWVKKFDGVTFVSPGSTANLSWDIPKGVELAPGLLAFDGRFPVLALSGREPSIVFGQGRKIYRMDVSGLEVADVRSRLAQIEVDAAGVAKHIFANYEPTVGRRALVEELMSGQSCTLAHSTIATPAESVRAELAAGATGAGFTYAELVSRHVPEDAVSVRQCCLELLSGDSQQLDQVIDQHVAMIMAGTPQVLGVVPAAVEPENLDTTSEPASSDS